MLDGYLAIQHCRVKSRLAGGQHGHEVRVGGELEDEETEAHAGLVLHADELLGVAGRAGEAGDALLEVLHDVGHAFEAVLGGVALAFLGRPRGDGEEGCALEEQEFFGFDGKPEVSEVALDDGEVRHEVVNDGRPGLVQALIPDGRGKGGELDGADVHADRVDVLERLLADDADAVVVDGLARRGLDEVHLVDEDVDLGRGGELQEGGQDGDVGGEVAVDVARLNVEDVDEDADVGEDVHALLREVVLHEGLLAAAVPEVEGEVAEELYVGEIDVDGGASETSNQYEIS